MTTREAIGEVFCDAIAACELENVGFLREVGTPFADRMARKAAEQVVSHLADGLLFSGTPEDFLRLVQEETARRVSELPDPTPWNAAREQSAKP